MKETVVTFPSHYSTHEAIWMWHNDGGGPVIFRWIDNAWEAPYGLRLTPGIELPGQWNFCTSNPHTYLPTNLECLGLLLSIGISQYPVWFTDKYYSAIGHSVR